MGAGADIRRSPSWAHVLPLALFLGISSLTSMVAVENPLLPWWRHAPEHWVYPLQTLVAGGALAFFWQHYRFGPWRGVKMGILFGVLGIVWWCLPALGYQWLVSGGVAVPSWLEWLGLAPRSDGFDPSLFSDQPAWYAVILLLRFVRMVIVVPLVEEIFWRGFLMRHLQAESGSFLQVPFGTHSWKAYGAVTGFFMVAHANVDWVGALGFGSLMYLLAVRRKSLGACVLMHAVANLLLGLYVVATKQWGFW